MSSCAVRRSTWPRSIRIERLFNANLALVFYMTAIGVMFLMLHFDLWPLTKFPGLMKQPVLGLVWTAICLASGGVLFYVGVFAMAMDPLQFMVRVPIPFIFGTIIVLNMLQGSLFAKHAQPLKGILSAAAAAVIGTGLALLYGAFGADARQRHELVRRASPATISSAGSLRRFWASPSRS